MFSRLVDSWSTLSRQPFSSFVFKAVDCCSGRHRGQSDSIMDGASILCGGTKELPTVTFLHKYFEEAVEDSTKAGGHGIVFRDVFLSYSDLNKKANVMARVISKRLQLRHLRNQAAVQPVIAVDIEPCETLLIVLISILKLGAVYLPVDSHSAINRVRYILNETRPTAILVDSTSVFKKETDTIWSGFSIIDVDDITDRSINGHFSLENLSSKETLHSPHLLSMIYTSGSTGKPKGVCLSHSTAMNRVWWQWHTFPFRENEVGCFKTSLLFVDSIVEIFSCLLKLVPLVVVPKGVTTNPQLLVNLMEQHSVSRITTVPSLLRSMLTYLAVSCSGGQRLSALWLWVSNSETLRPSLIETFFEVFLVDKTIANFYGSTETMADVTYEIFTCSNDITEKSRDGHISIGRPMFNNNVYITDEDLNAVPLGQPGEICVSGLNVAESYLDGAGKNSFLSNPFREYTSANHDRIYKTGDFGLIDRGLIIYQGRRDTQVKIRGQRVNIVEIEKVIQESASVEKVVVCCHTLSEISSVIVAYYTTHNRKRDSCIESVIMQGCKKSLPIYMIPKLIYLEEIPLQPHTGKVDRIVLRKLYEKASNRQSSQELAILDEKSQKALNIIALNLNLPGSAIPRQSSFFEAGGNSMSMIATIVQLKEYGLHIPIEDFSSARTIQQIIDHVTENTVPIGEILQTDRYIIKPLRDVLNSELLIQVMVGSFVKKEPLLVLLGITKDEFMPFAKSLHREALKGRISLIVLDKKTNEIVGGDYLFDYFKQLDVEHHESMAPILSLLANFEEPVKERLEQCKSGKLIYNFCLCVHEDLPHAEQVKICHLIEESVLNIARTDGYVGVITNNTNPVTQDICEHFFDYKLLAQFLVRDFDFNGRRVFAHAPEDYNIKMMMKLV